MVPSGKVHVDYSSYRFAVTPVHTFKTTVNYYDESGQLLNVGYLFNSDIDIQMNSYVMGLPVGTYYIDLVN